MSRTKRLFLLAGYDKDAVIDNAFIWQAKALRIYGDVIIYMDNKYKKNQSKKLHKTRALSTFAIRHREYDFGSYKRAFKYACDKDILGKYDYMYLVNDSVFGPMFNMRKILAKMEGDKHDAVSLVESRHKTHRFMESWFVRLNPKIFTSDWFKNFLNSVKKEPNKDMVTIKYEHGLTKLIEEHDCSWGAIYSVRGRQTYNRPKYLFTNGCPFVKKASFTRHNGAFGKQIKYILRNSDPVATRMILKTANRLYGEKYMNNFLTSNPLKILWRNLTYAITKLNPKKNVKKTK